VTYWEGNGYEYFCNISLMVEEPNLLLLHFMNIARGVAVKVIKNVINNSRLHWSMVPGLIDL
jgi:hypothetical protein